MYTKCTHIIYLVLVVDARQSNVTELWSVADRFFQFAAQDTSGPYSHCRALNRIVFKHDKKTFGGLFGTKDQIRDKM